MEQLSFDHFASRLRRNSLYPTFRRLVAWIYIAWLGLAAISAIAALLGVIFAPAGQRLIPLLSGLFTALICIVVGKVFKESSQMIADLSDAAVRIAARDDFD